VRVLILGAGFAGLQAAHDLAPLGAAGKLDVTLIDRAPAFQMGFAMQWALDGRRGPDGGRREYPPKSSAHVRHVRAAVRAIDTQSKSVATDAGDFPYDRLVLALGAELTMEDVPGLAGAGHNLYAMDTVMRFRQELAKVEGGTVLVSIVATPYKCPPAPFEYALLIDEALRRAGVRDACGVVVTSPEGQPMTVAGEEVGEKVREMLADRDIEFRPRHRLTRVDGAARTAHFEGQSDLPFALLAAVPTHRAPAVVRQAGLADESGFVPVELGTFKTRQEGVFAVGDMAGLRLPGGGHHPKAGVFAELQGAAVASAIAAEVGGGRAVTYRGHGVCFMEVGGGRAAMADANLLAPDGPRFRLDEPGPAALEAKVNFERERLDRWFGEQ
jgi:sulfide:quinone oxidoreductase